MDPALLRWNKPSLEWVLRSSSGFCWWSCCGAVCDSFPWIWLWEFLFLPGTGFLQAPAAVPRLLLRPPWVSRCCNPCESARPHPVNSQRNVPVAGVETSCGHLGKSELYSLSTFLMAQPTAAAGGKYSTHGPCVCCRQRDKTCSCGGRGEGYCCVAFPAWGKTPKAKYPEVSGAELQNVFRPEVLQKTPLV